MKTLVKKPENIDLIKQTWISDATRLIDQMESWLRSDPAALTIERTSIEIEEDDLGKYSVPKLEADFGEGAITFEPIARNLPWEGIVQIQAWSTLHRVRLIKDSVGQTGVWIVMTDSGIPLRQEWNEHNFQILCHDLLAF